VQPRASIQWARICHSLTLLGISPTIEPDGTDKKCLKAQFENGIFAFNLPTSYLSNPIIPDSVSVDRFNVILHLLLLYLSLTWSRCIFQDDPKDWNREASLMRDVYSNATFCIAATDAKDSTVGLFFDRDPSFLQAVHIRTTCHLVPLYPSCRSLAPGIYWRGTHPIQPQVIIDRSPLNKRAWVAQERYLSPRTLHFAREVFFWECRELLSSETHPDGADICVYCGGSNHSLRTVIKAANNFSSIQSNQNTINHADDAARSESDNTVESIAWNESELHSNWCVFRSIYAQCQLTQGDDVLVALRGISLQFEEMLKDRLIFGLWKGRLLEDLAWSIELLSPGQIH
jgi:hypothetical protein